MNAHLRRLPLALRLGLPLAATALVAAACSSSGGSSGSSTAASTAGSSAPSTAPATASSVTTITAHSGSAGMYLTDSSGRSLYLYTPDKTSTSTCTGGCAAAWPPLTAKGTPKATGPATASELGVTKRADGSEQVTYAGHPLYYFAGDKGAGQTNGEGSENIWFLVSPGGARITKAASTSSSASSSGSGSGGW